MKIVRSITKDIHSLELNLTKIGSIFLYLALRFKPNEHLIALLIRRFENLFDSP